MGAGHYDDTNRLALLSMDGHDSRLDFSYIHNGLGQRTRKDLPGEQIDTVYDESGLRLADKDWLLTCGSEESLIGGGGGGGSGGPGTTGMAGGAGSASSGGATTNGGSVTNSICTQTAKSRTEYIYLDGLPIAVARYAGTSTTAQLSYLETDHLGTPRLASDAATQAVQWRWDLLQTSFGDHPATALVSGFELNLRYPGQYFDAETGLHYNYFRDYEPKSGRYAQSDPVGLGAGMSTFGYVESNPLRAIDPYGLEAWLCQIGKKFYITIPIKFIMNKGVTQADIDSIKQDIHTRWTGQFQDYYFNVRVQEVTNGPNKPVRVNLGRGSSDDATLYTIPERPTTYAHEAGHWMEEPDRYYDKRYNGNIMGDGDERTIWMTDIYTIIRSPKNLCVLTPPCKCG